MNPVRLSTRTLIVAGAATVVLAGASTVGWAAASGAFRDASTAPNGQCSAPALSGTVVDVTLADMGSMMGGRGMMGGYYAVGGTMRILTSTNQVPAGSASFRVANAGTLVHELVILPLPAGQALGARAVGANGSVDESGSLAEASRTCGEGAGDGINPGAIGWVTVNLPAGHYELICNFPGHYGAGMDTELTVT
jgi:uncharacterized cupredoxin-like copper-binding protein